MNNPGLIKAFDATAAIAKYRIVKHGSNDGEAVQAAAATDALLGVANSLGAASGERVDITLTGACTVEYGGTVTRGALLTSDADGKAVAAAPAAGVNNRTIGIAMVSGVSGDYGSVLLGPSQIQGAYRQGDARQCRRQGYRHR